MFAAMSPYGEALRASLRNSDVRHYRGPPAVASGRGDGVLLAARSLAWFIGQGAAVADFNRDGRPDLAFAPGATDDEAPPPSEAYVYLNATGLPTPPCVVMNLGIRSWCGTG
jgi:hypothetical protein